LKSFLLQEVGCNVLLSSTCGQLQIQIPSQNTHHDFFDPRRMKTRASEKRLT
jgi:hypothetical protein